MIAKEFAVRAVAKLKSLAGLSHAPALSLWKDSDFVDHHLKRLPPLTEPRVMVNVGAHKGHEAFEFAARGWDVYSFEANPTNYAALRSAVEECGLAKPPEFIHAAVVANDEPEVTFYVSDRHPGIGSLASFSDTHRPITVKARTLKSLYEEKGIKAIDYFLMDAERQDFRLIQAHDWSIPINVIMLEFHASYLRHVVNYIGLKAPEMQHAIFMLKKRDNGFWEEGKANPLMTVDRVTIEEFEARKAVPDHPKYSGWGNVVFYRP